MFLKLGFCVSLLACVVLGYLAIAWMAFQFRNPTLNDSAFFTHFQEVITFR